MKSGEAADDLDVVLLDERVGAIVLIDEALRRPCG